MTYYYLLVKKTGCKKWNHIIPVKKSTPKKDIGKSAKRLLKKGFRYRVINKTALSKYMKKRYSA